MFRLASRSITARSYSQRRIIASGGRHFSSLERDLATFPEYQESQTDFANGQFKRALPGMLRVQTVITNALGATSPMAIHIALRAGQALQYLGDFEKGAVLIEGAVMKSDNPSDGATKSSHAAPSIGALMPSQHNEHAVRALQAASLLHLFNGSAHMALDRSTSALQICQDNSSVPTSLFSPTHGLIGLCHYHLGDFQQAEEHLQLAARWADSQSQQLIALNNLGQLFWMCGKDLTLQDDEMVMRVDPRLQRIREKTLWQQEGDSASGPRGGNDHGAVGIKTSGNAPSSSPSAQKYQAFSQAAAREALLYWGDALEEATRDPATGKGPGAASSMCGPLSSADPLGPGMKAKTIPKSQLAASSAGESEDKGRESTALTDGKGSRVVPTGVASSDALSTNLQDLNFAITYSTLLCNAAAAHHELQEKDKADSMLASALRALDPHKANLASHPALGRVLCSIAYINMSAAMAVTAEGLFRSAIDKLEGPYSCNDPRFRYERMIAMGGYSVLLSKWEKREKDGQRLLDKATDIYEGLPLYCLRENGASEHSSLYHSRLLLLTPGFIYPTVM